MTAFVKVFGVYFEKWAQRCGHSLKKYTRRQV